MRIIKIEPYDNGAHANQQASGVIVPPEGWAIIPPAIEIPDTFPFVNVEAKNGIVTSLTPGMVPNVEQEPEEEPYSIMDDIDEMLVDHEYRLTILELGV